MSVDVEMASPLDSVALADARAHADTVVDATDGATEYVAEVAAEAVAEVAAANATADATVNASADATVHASEVAVANALLHALADARARALAHAIAYTVPVDTDENAAVACAVRRVLLVSELAPVAADKFAHLRAALDCVGVATVV